MSRSSRYYTAPVPKMPAGIIELMDGLARDVLKNNPPDVYEFCANHMKKLLHIRDEIKKPNSTVNRVLTLEEKITLAKKIIRERAALRREEYDKNMQDFNSKDESDINRKHEDDVKTEMEQYNKGNIVKIREVDLSSNTEHEIIARDFKLNEDTTVLQEIEKVSNTQPIDIVNYEHSKDLEDVNKEEILLETDKTEPAGHEDIVTKVIDEENKTKEVECSAQDSVIKNENITETIQVSESESEYIDAPNVPIEIKKEKIVCSNDQTENKDSITPPKDKEDNTNISNNHNDKVNIVEELNITVTYNSDKSTQSIDNVKENEIDKSQIDVSGNVDNNESNSNLTTDIKVSSSENNETSLAINSNDTKSQELSNETNEEFKQPSPIIDENAEEDKRNYQELVNEVNNTSMDLETAAITIQKVFRSFLFRNKTLSSDEATNVDINLLIEDKENTVKEVVSDAPKSGNANKDRRTLGLSRIDTVLQTVNEEKSLSLSTDDSSTLSSAATIIQAHVRGYLVRNKINFNKANSSTSGFDSDGHSMTSFEVDDDPCKNKTILNIHIVPEGGHFMCRDESMLNSIDLSVDGSPPNSTNLHPMVYDTSERRKQLKREDAIQSISPPSNNSDKQSVEVDSVKEILESSLQQDDHIENNTIKVNMQDVLNENITSLNIDHIETGLTAHDSIKTSDSSLPSLTSDELDVVTPFAATDSDNDSRIMHSSEFHDVVLPTKVNRTDTSVVRGE